MNWYEFSEELKNQLLTTGIKGRDLSGKIDRNFAYISQILNGRIKKVDYSTSRKIFEQLNVIKEEDMDNFLYSLGVEVPNYNKDSEPKENNECCKVGEDCKMKFGEFLKIEKENIGISGKTLSKKIEKSTNYISSIEKGLFNPDYVTAIKIFKALKLNMVDKEITELLPRLGIEVPAITIDNINIKKETENKKLIEFRLINIYSKNDEEQMNDPIEVQLFDENHKLIMSGNWKDRINEKIEGFFTGLNYLKVDYDIDRESINAKSL
jgi:transcriptional regulator with XRE-family HTH domain